jgi:hypothetical protein
MTCSLLQFGHLQNVFVTDIWTEAVGGAISDTHALLLRQTGQFFFVNSATNLIASYDSHNFAPSEIVT